LRDIVLPTEPGLWPPAPGWWLLGVLFLLTAFGLVRWLVKLLRERQTRRRLRRELEQALDQQQSPQARIAMMSELLRRWSKLQSPGAASLLGDAWLRTLDAGLPDAPFSDGVGRLLLQGPFMVQPPLQQLQELEALVRRRILHEAPHA
jgi:hypothetical protein